MKRLPLLADMQREVERPPHGAYTGDLYGPNYNAGGGACAIGIWLHVDIAIRLQGATWAARGFFNFLIADWPIITRQSPEFEQWPAARWNWQDILEQAAETGGDIAALQALALELEKREVIWVINRGSEIIELELR
jgi:hypothetical protein